MINSKLIKPLRARLLLQKKKGDSLLAQRRVYGGGINAAKRSKYIRVYSNRDHPGQVGSLYGHHHHSLKETESSFL